MLTELRTKSQITIPKDIVARLGLHEGDKLEIVEISFCFIRYLSESSLHIVETQSAKEHCYYKYAA